MTTDPTTDIAALKKRVDQLRQDRDKAKGALGELLRRLKEDFGTLSVKDARTKLKSLQKERDKIAKAYKEELAVFQEKWKDLLK